MQKHSINQLIFGYYLPFSIRRTHKKLRKKKNSIHTIKIIILEMSTLERLTHLQLFANNIINYKINHY